MEQIKQLARDLRSNEAARASSDTYANSNLTDSDMLTLWQAMGEMYGHRWSSAYGGPTQTRHERTGETVEVLSSAVKTWRRVLQGITRDELAKGIRDCVRRAEEWPPSAPVFRERCRPYREPGGRPVSEVLRCLPPKPSNREVGRAALREIKQMLGRP